MRARMQLLAVFLALTLGALAQDTVPLITYEIHAEDVVREGFTGSLHWGVAPDQSLILSIGGPHGKRSIRRITNWMGPTPKEESINLENIFPKRPRGSYRPNEDFLIDPQGRFLVLRYSASDLVVAGPFKTTHVQADFAVIELPAFRLVERVELEGERAGGSLTFSSNGTLLSTSWVFDGQRGFDKTVAVSLPGLETSAACVYKVDYIPIDAERRNFDKRISGEQGYCSGLLSRTGSVSVQEMVEQMEKRGRIGTSPLDQCLFLLTSEDATFALARCGKDHFADKYGDFAITFWNSLKVVRLPEGRTVLSLPLRFNDDKTTGIFAKAEGQDYLITRKYLTLKIYRLP